MFDQSRAVLLASIKRVGDLQAFSCLEFGTADSSVTLRPRSVYVLKVPTTPFRDQVVNLQAEDGPLDSGCYYLGL